MAEETEIKLLLLLLLLYTKINIQKLKIYYILIIFTAI